jgi:hypothetical protein
LSIAGNHPVPDAAMFADIIHLPGQRLKALRSN